VVLVESMKFSEAQKRPDSALVNVSHLLSASSSVSATRTGSPLFTFKIEIIREESCPVKKDLNGLQIFTDLFSRGRRLIDADP
jgi:hypothetical protein